MQETLIQVASVTILVSSNLGSDTFDMFGMTKLNLHLALQRPTASAALPAAATRTPSAYSKLATDRDLAATIPSEPLQLAVIAAF